MNFFKKIRSFITIPRSIYHYKKGSLKLPYMPTAAWIEPTNICNLKCIMCPNSVIKQENPGFMSFDLFKKIIDEGKNYFSNIILCLAGEPFLNKNLIEMVRHASENNIGTMISTNATVMNKEVSREIIKAGLKWINFSFDGCSKEIYEKVRIGANFENTINNIIDFLEVKKELNSKVEVEIQILIMDKNGQKNFQENIEKFKKRFNNLPLNNIQARTPSTWGGILDGTDKYEYKKLGFTYSPCSYLWSSMYFLWDGTVVACCTDFWGLNKLGKFPDQSIKDIWNNKKFQDFRRAMLNKQYNSYFKYCDKCDSLYSEHILGLPAGIRGISVYALSSIFGYSIIKLFKKVATKINSDFVMKPLKK